MEIIGRIVVLAAMTSRRSYDRIGIPEAQESAMSDEEVTIPRAGPHLLAESDDLEEVLELLIKLAQSEQREFLAYLLRMALIEARNDAPDKTYRPQ